MLKETSSIKKWKKLANELYLNSVIISNIEFMYGSNYKYARSAVIREWIETSESPTWKNIGDALLTMGHVELAKKIFHSYNGIPKLQSLIMSIAIKLV